TAIDPLPVTLILPFPVALKESLPEGSSRQMELASAWASRMRGSSTSTVGTRQRLRRLSLGVVRRAGRRTRSRNVRKAKGEGMGSAPWVLEAGPWSGARFFPGQRATPREMAARPGSFQKTARAASRRGRRARPPLVLFFFGVTGYRITKGTGADTPRTGS